MLKERLCKDWVLHKWLAGWRAAHWITAMLPCDWHLLLQAPSTALWPQGSARKTQFIACTLPSILTWCTGSRECPSTHPFGLLSGVGHKLQGGRVKFCWSPDPDVVAGTHEHIVGVAESENFLTYGPKSRAR